jgi:hypothetical protein
MMYDFGIITLIHLSDEFVLVLFRDGKYQWVPKK